MFSIPTASPAQCQCQLGVRVTTKSLDWVPLSLPLSLFLSLPLSLALTLALTY